VSKWIEQKEFHHSQDKHLSGDSAWAANISEHAAIDEFPCKEGLPNQQHCLDLGTVDLPSQLGSHSREESLHARAQVIRCTGAEGRVTPEPSFKHQGVLF
jgi:hypothetical protein